MEHEGDGDTNYNWSTWNDPKNLGKGSGELRKGKMSRDYFNYILIEVSQNTEKSPGDE